MRRLILATGVWPGRLGYIDPHCVHRRDGLVDWLYRRWVMRLANARFANRQEGDK